MHVVHILGLGCWQCLDRLCSLSLLREPMWMHLDGVAQLKEAHMCFRKTQAHQPVVKCLTKGPHHQKMHGGRSYPAHTNAGASCIKANQSSGTVFRRHLEVAEVNTAPGLVCFKRRLDRCLTFVLCLIECPIYSCYLFPGAKSIPYRFRMKMLDRFSGYRRLAPGEKIAERAKERTCNPILQLSLCVNCWAVLQNLESSPVH